MEHPKLDADADLYVSIVREDVDRATPGDHCNCAVAQAIKRAVGRPDTEAVIFPSVAYVLMPADTRTIRANELSGQVKRGQLAWYRFRISPEMSAEILSFDETGEFAAEGYRFRAPTPSQTLRAKRLRSKEIQNPGSRSGIQDRMPWRRDRYYRVDRAAVRVVEPTIAPGHELT